MQSEEELKRHLYLQQVASNTLPLSSAHAALQHPLPVLPDQSDHPKFRLASFLYTFRISGPLDQIVELRHTSSHTFRAALQQQNRRRMDTDQPVPLCLCVRSAAGGVPGVLVPQHDL